jgi:hypothetical protein
MPDSRREFVFTRRLTRTSILIHRCGREGNVKRHPVMRWMAFVVSEISADVFIPN